MAVSSAGEGQSQWRARIPVLQVKGHAQAVELAGLGVSSGDDRCHVSFGTCQFPETRRSMGWGEHPPEVLP